MSDTTAKKPILYIFSGLPGSGKTTLAQAVAPRLAAAYVRIDTIEQALRDLCHVDVQGEGYRLAYRIAADNLGAGISVVADSCNPIELTRREWRQVALDVQALFIDIEVVCTDQAEHRRRIETRRSTVAGLKLPDWEDVKNRDYHTWTTDRIVTDTAHRSEAECVRELLDKLAHIQG